MRWALLAVAVAGCKADPKPAPAPPPRSAQITAPARVAPKPAPVPVVAPAAGEQLLGASTPWTTPSGDALAVGVVTDHQRGYARVVVQLPTGPVEAGRVELGSDAIRDVTVTPRASDVLVVMQATGGKGRAWRVLWNPATAQPVTQWEELVDGGKGTPFPDKHR